MDAERGVQKTCMCCCRGMFKLQDSQALCDLWPLVQKDHLDGESRMMTHHDLYEECVHLERDDAVCCCDKKCGATFSDKLMQLS